MTESKSVIHDVVAELAQQYPEEFADFWTMPQDQQTELIERYGTDSERNLWRMRDDDSSATAG